jgi:hypothetical protein
MILEKSCLNELIAPKIRTQVERRKCPLRNFIKVRIPFPIVISDLNFDEKKFAIELHEGWVLKRAEKPSEK